MRLRTVRRLEAATARFYEDNATAYADQLAGRKAGMSKAAAVAAFYDLVRRIGDVPTLLATRKGKGPRP